MKKLILIFAIACIFSIGYHLKFSIDKINETKERERIEEAEARADNQLRERKRFIVELHPDQSQWRVKDTQKGEYMPVSYESKYMAEDICKKLDFIQQLAEANTKGEN